MAQTATANGKLATVIAENGLSHAQIARTVLHVATQVGADELAGTGRSHVSKWVAGVRPSGRGTAILCEALSRLTGRVITPDEIGLEPTGAAMPGSLDWRTDTLVALADLGRGDVDVARRRVLSTAAFSLAALALPPASWWSRMAARGQARHTSSGRQVGRADVDTVREMVQLFSALDQRRGGGHGRTAVAQYLIADVLGSLHGTFATDQIRRDMFTAASELTYLSGWMAFDHGVHRIAQGYFQVSVKLAAEADDPAMAAHVLRAMAHQAVDLGARREALALAEASIHGRRYTQASPREKALIGVVHARALAAVGERAKAAAALLQAENDLRRAEPGDAEPGRVAFFGEASLAHETACTLRELGDPTAAISQFRRSVRTRKAATYARTHAVTLGYLGEAQAGIGQLEQACATWSKSLDAMTGVRSGRTRLAAKNIRAVLSPFRGRGLPIVLETDARAAAYLAVSH